MKKYGIKQKKNVCNSEVLHFFFGSVYYYHYYYYYYYYYYSIKRFTAALIVRAQIIALNDNLAFPHFIDFICIMTEDKSTIILQCIKLKLAVGFIFVVS